MDKSRAYGASSCSLAPIPTYTWPGVGAQPVFLTAITRIYTLTLTHLGRPLLIPALGHLLHRIPSYRIRLRLGTHGAAASNLTIVAQRSIQDRLDATDRGLSSLALCVSAPCCWNSALLRCCAAAAQRPCHTGCRLLRIGSCLLFRCLSPLAPPHTPYFLVLVSPPLTVTAEPFCSVFPTPSVS